MKRAYQAKGIATGSFHRKQKVLLQAVDNYETIFRDLLAAAPDAIVVLNPNGSIALANSQTEKLFGYNPAELLGKPVEVLLPERLREAHVGHRRVYRSRPYTRPMGARTDLVGRRKDGSEFPAEISISPTRTNQGVLVISIIRDITERKRSEEQVQQHNQCQAVLRDINLAVTSKLDLRSVLNILMEKINILLSYPTVQVWLLSEDGKQMDRAACWNLDEKEWKGRELRGTPPLVQATVDAKKPIVTGNIQTDPRTRHPKFFRSHGLVSYIGLPLLVKGEVLGNLALLTREEHQFSEEEVEFLSTLANQAAIAIQNSRLYEQTKKQAKQLDKTNKIKDEFLSVMSHELRTPLNAILGYTGMMQDKMLGELSPEQEKALAKVMSRSNDLLTMITNILNVTKIGADETKVECYETSPKQLLDDLRLLYDLPPDKELALCWDYPSDLPMIHNDGAKLKHILQNLIDNAIKFTQMGQVTISARHVFKAKTVEFKVTDTGIGIPKEKIPIIFELFRQGDNSETRVYGGVGIGLYIAKKFSELLGGKIEVKSEPGRGATFTVMIPVS